MIIEGHAASRERAYCADLCIIGAGPAGIALAREFLGTSSSVIVLESGGARWDAAAGALSEGEIVGTPLPGMESGRRRAFGGTSVLWSGVCSELDELDFLPRSWIANSGWPLEKHDLARYYERARAFFGVPSQTSVGEKWSARERGLRRYRGDRLRSDIGVTARHLNVSARYRAELAGASNVTVLLDATVTALRTDPAGTNVVGLDFHCGDGSSKWVAARSFVIAAGGIESARLLLVSNAQHPAGIGNRHDMVGRFFQEHPEATVAHVDVSDFERLRSNFGRRYGKRLSYVFRTAISPQTQRDEELTQCRAEVVFDQPDDSALASLKRLRNGWREGNGFTAASRELRSLARRPRETAALLFDRYVRFRHPIHDASRASIVCTVEQEPNPESRLTLSKRCDHFGVPFPKIDWRLGEREFRTLRAMTAMVADEFRDLELGTVAPAPWLSQTRTKWTAHIRDSFHHMGTTRMSSDPKRGVVDADCRVHGVNNLFICSSGVFPTSGHTNPTLTIVALALRVADHLRSDG